MGGGNTVAILRCMVVLSWGSAVVGKMTSGTQIMRLTWALGLQLCNLKDPGSPDPHPTQTRGQGRRAGRVLLPANCVSLGKTTTLLSASISSSEE